MIPPMVKNVAMVSVGCLKTVTITHGAKVMKICLREPDRTFRM